MAKDKPSSEKTNIEREETVRNLEPSRDTPRGTDPYSEEELKAFSEKLKAWGKTLPDRERELLAGILVAASPEDEVSGFDLGRAASGKFGDKIFVVLQDVTVNKAKTADKAFNAMDAYIRG